MPLRGALDALGASYLPFDGKIDVAYFLDQPNADVAARALSFLADQGNGIELAKRHSPQEVTALWRSTLRSCIAHGVALTPEQRLYAAALGVAL